MGDRTTVTLCIPKEFEEITSKLIADDPWDTSSTEKLSYLVFEEVNYGELSNLDLLIENGIPYTATWERGGEFDPGSEYARFTPEGNVEVKTIYCSDESIPIHVLLSWAEKSTQFLLDSLNDANARIAVLPWDNQVQYGKIYKTKLLITGNK
jgi:hypothetical protein